MPEAAESEPAREAKLTARQEVLLAAAEISDFRTGIEFTEWDLTVKAWKLNPGRWGLPGYESAYPDHKRVMNELMAAGTERIVGRGWLERSSTNHYRLTPAGLEQAFRIRSSDRTSTKRDYALYDALEPLAFHRVFESYLSDQSEPKIWLGAAAFLGLSKNDPEFFERRLSSVKHITADALEFMRAGLIDQLKRGDAGRSITLERVARLEAFIAVLEDRFKPQIAAIRGRVRKQEE